jgi:hypothetical protein
MINNGLFWSDDANWTEESSTEVSLDTDDNYLADLHSSVMINAAKANQVAGRKVVIFYGTSILPLFNSLYPNTQIPFKVALQQVLGSNYGLVEMPAACTPNSANGWLIANLDQTKLHYTVLPALRANGTNEEKGYNWFNFLMGSCMLEVLADNGVVKQPATLES